MNPEKKKTFRVFSSLWWARTHFRTKKMDQISIQILVLLDSVFFQGKNLTGEISFLMGVHSKLKKKTAPAFPAFTYQGARQLDRNWSHIHDPLEANPKLSKKKKVNLEVRYFFQVLVGWLVDFKALTW